MGIFTNNGKGEQFSTSIKNISAVNLKGNPHGKLRLGGREFKSLNVSQLHLRVFRELQRMLEYSSSEGGVHSLYFTWGYFYVNTTICFMLMRHYSVFGPHAFNITFWDLRELS